LGFIDDCSGCCNGDIDGDGDCVGVDESCVSKPSNLLIILSDLLKKIRYMVAAIRINTARNPKLIRYLIY
jgi:hypothetical protein